MRHPWFHYHQKYIILIITITIKCGIIQVRYFTKAMEKNVSITPVIALVPLEILQNKFTYPFIKKSCLLGTKYQARYFFY